MSALNRPLKPPALQTLANRPSTAPTPSPSTPTTAVPETPTARLTSPADSTTGQKKSKRSHQHFVLADPVAFSYLEEDATTSVVERRAELKGYQCYLVEQWATSRSHPTFTIVTYSGDQSHSVMVGVLSVPTDESTWSPKLRVYFKALNQYHARRSETRLGILMVTNLAGFPSSLTVISVPSGDLQKHRADFFVNENLKRLGCSGRMGLSLAPPAGATVAKFQQLYHTSDKNDIYKSVVGLVKLCQTALALFGKLEEVYVDGLLCDFTERAVNDWWRDIGGYYYNIEPHDGILGPTAVAGLLGLLIGARNRLHSIGAPVAKDAFDAEAMKRGISTFQKQQKLSRTRRLDRRTFERLHRATERQAEHGGWAVPKAVKSTVAELSGKGGEMVMDAVGRRDRAGIAEVETVDMERFTQVLSGERSKWLWYGKPLKKSKDISGHLDMDERDDTPLVTSRDGEQSAIAPASRKGTMEEQVNDKKFSLDVPRPTVDESHETEDGRFRSAVKRTTGLKDAGVNRLKGAVRLGGGHQEQRSSQKSSKDEQQSPSSPQSPESDENARKRRPNLLRAQTSPTHPSAISKPVVDDDRAESASQARGSALSRLMIPPAANGQSAPPYTSGTKADLIAADGSPPPSYMATERGTRGDNYGTSAGEDIPAKPTIANSIYHDVNLDETLPNGPETERNVGLLLQRSQSFSRYQTATFQKRSNDAYPRHLSFSLAEESVLTWQPLVEHKSPSAILPSNFKGQYLSEEFFAREATDLRHLLGSLSADVAPWTDAQLSVINAFLERAHGLEQEFDALYQPRSEGVQAVHASSEGVMREQKDRLEEGRKEIETLAAKLEYEIDGLRGRIEDVVAGVQDFRKGVQRVEERVGELEKDQERADRGWACGVM